MLFLISTSLISLVSSLTPPSRGVPGGVYFCTGRDWIGDCVWAPGDLGKCHPMNFPRPDGLDGNMGGKTSSIGPDWGALCTFYTKEDCTGREINLSYPGANQLPPLFHHNVWSWKCLRQ